VDQGQQANYGISREKTSVQAGIFYTIAIHGDNKSFREGIAFVIDTSKQGCFKKVGNEGKLSINLIHCDFKQFTWLAPLPP
jgi:hypothetical protein